MSTSRPVAVSRARLRLVSAASALLLLVAACSSGDDSTGERDGAEGGVEGGVDQELVATTDPDVPQGTWTGRFGDDAFVAVVVGPDQVAAYACEDGKIGSWFFGPPPAGATLQLANAAGHRLTVELGDEVTGTFDDGEVVHEFVAAPTDSEALLRADTVVDGAPVVGGWIRIGDETRGTVSTSTGLQPAPTLATTVQLQISPTVLATMSPAPMTPDTLSTPTANTTTFVWAAGGDSFGSGEGNPERGIADPDDYESFSGLRWGDDASIAIPIGGVSLAADVTTCHRSDEAGAPKANRKLTGLYPGVRFTLGFVACGGAQTVNMRQSGYTGPSSTAASLLGHSRVTQPAQLDRINGFRTSRGRLDALYMSVGGNDMGFGPIIESCVSPVGPPNCAEQWDSELGTRGQALSASYDLVEQRIVQLFGNNLPVFVSEYPNPVHDQVAIESPPVCFDDDYRRHGEVQLGGLDDFLEDNITIDEALFAFGISERINTQVRSAAIRNGWNLVAQHVQASARHGLCTDTPHFNLNSAAVRRQGRDIPDTLHLVFSSGLLHPNNAGFEAYGDAITAALRPTVDNVVRSGLAAPTNVRIAAATATSLTLRWNDRATAENAFDVEITPARTADAGRLVYPPGVTRLAGGAYVQRVTGTDAQQLVQTVTAAGQFKYRVRACHTAITSGERCGPYSAQITGTNAAPAAPTGITVRNTTRIVNARPQPFFTVGWNPQVDAIEYVVRLTSTTGTGAPVDVRTTGTSVERSGLMSTVTVAVAACNRIGCSTFRSPG